MPIFQASPCPGEITAVQVENFRRDGFLAFTGVLSEREVETAKADLRAALETLRVQHRADCAHRADGDTRSWRANSSDLTIQFESSCPPPAADDEALELKVRKFHHVTQATPALRALAFEHPKIGGILAALIGQNPILAQDMALVKPPGGAAKPWHQDDAYFKIAPLDAVCGVWIALDDAGVENGCMHVWAGQHHGALRHYHGSDCEIMPDRLANAREIAVPLPPGGALFFSGLLPHHTPPNGSPERRRALQFHYRARDSRLVEDAQYNAIFAEADGTPASCAAAVRGF